MRGQIKLRYAIGFLLVVSGISYGIWLAKQVGSEACTEGNSSCSWTLTLIDSALGSWPMPRGMAVDAEGNIHLAGESYPEATDYTRNEILLAKYDPSGSPIWVRHYAAPGADGFNIAYGLALDSAGNICVGGITDGSYLNPSQPPSRKGFVARYDAQGQLLWAVDRPREVLAVAHDQEGNCYASSNLGITKLTAQGKEAWSYYRPMSGIVITPQGVPYILGKGSEASRPYLISFDSRGQVAREIALQLTTERDWKGTQFSWLSLEADTRGHLYLHANVSGTDGAGNIRIVSYLAKLTLNGQLLWERYYGVKGERWDSFDHAVDEQGVLVSGMYQSILGAGPLNAFVMRYDTEGNLQWVRQHKHTADNGAGSIGVDRHGNYYIAGATRSVLDGQPIAKERTNTPLIARNRP